MAADSQTKLRCVLRAVNGGDSSFEHKIIMLYNQGQIKTSGGPHAKGSWGPSPFLPSPALPSIPSPSLPPLPSLPSPPLPSYLSPFSLLSLRSRLKIQLGSLGERCKLIQWGLGRSPCRQTIWCIFESKRAALVAAIFTALHVMQTRYCDDNSVCPSVRHTRVL